MFDLTQRQIEILKHIVKEYTDTAEPVGSETLEKKYDLGVSPATIRNEMKDMVRLGYLAKPHASAGRVPTSRALKFYINELMKEKELSTSEEVEAKEKVWDLRGKEDKFLKEVSKNLAQKTHELAVTTTDEGDLFYSGYANILKNPEFFDISVTENFLQVLDDYSYINEVIKRIENECLVLLGDELGFDLLRPYGFIFARFNTKRNHSGSVGVVGPARMKYDYTKPYVEYFKELIEEVAEW